MRTDELPVGPTFETLSTATCWRHAETAVVGRIGFVADGVVQILPVNFMVQSGSVYFRTTAYGAVARHVDGQAVSFEVDEIDREHQGGWSVLVTGHARRVDDSETLAALWTPTRPHPWAEGVRTLWIEIDVQSISGRLVKA